MKFYRYEDSLTYNIGVTINVRKFDLIKETPRGYWIKPVWDYDENHKKWVHKTARSRYAYPTIEEARKNFIARKRRQIQILETRLGNAKSALWKMGEDL